MSLCLSLRAVACKKKQKKTKNVHRIYHIIKVHTNSKPYMLHTSIIPGVRLSSFVLIRSRTGNFVRDSSY
jgi:hypothetical protein